MMAVRGTPADAGAEAGRAFAGSPRWDDLGRAGDVAAGDRQRAIDREFERFYVAHVDRLVAQLYAYTNDLAQAQDVVQEAFARAVPRWERLARYDDPVAWVRRVAWNLATSRWRQIARLRAFVARQRAVSVPGPEPDRVALTVALSRLPDNQRRAVVLHYLEDMSIAEIATLMSTSPNTVKSWLHRGRLALATALTDTAEEGRHA